MPSIPEPDKTNHYLDEHIQLIYQSFQKRLGYPLLRQTTDKNALAKQLFYAPFALLSHDTAPDPILNYANAKALELFELNWQELIHLPSRLSAEPSQQANRDALMAQVTAQGFIEHYYGIRISKTGKRFAIHNAVIWNLTDDNEVYQGQAACFAEWTFL